MVEAGQVISQTLKREFSEEALAKLDMSEEKRKEIATKIDLLFHNGVEV